MHKQISDTCMYAYKKPDDRINYIIAFSIKKYEDIHMSVMREFEFCVRILICILIIHRIQLRTFSSHLLCYGYG